MSKLLERWAGKAVINIYRPNRVGGITILTFSYILLALSHLFDNNR